MRLRNTLGIFLVLGQFLVLITIVALGLRGGFLPDEMTTAVALVLPMFAVHTAAVVKTFIANRTAVTDTSAKLAGPFVFLSFFFPVLFTASLITITYIKAHNWGFTNFEQFKAVLGLTETAFAVYIGLIVDTLFVKNTALP